MLRKYVADPMHILPYEDLELKEDLSYEEQPMKILTREVRSCVAEIFPLLKFYGRISKLVKLLGKEMRSLNESIHTCLGS